MIPKVKAWHKELKELYQVTGLIFDLKGALIEIILPIPSVLSATLYGGSSISPHKIELLEWTGCKDNSGIGLYEKDIIFIRFGDRKLKGIVHWDDDHLTWWVEFLDNSGTGELLAEIHDFDIMGNGYTHPHLLVDE